MPSVFITGANRGLGLEFARQYAADGWRVVATCREPESASGLAGVAGDIAIHRLDVADFARIDALAAELAGQPIDLTILNAGLNKRPAGLGEMDYEAWADILRVNTMAPLKIVDAFLDHITRSEHKLVVAITSTLGSIGRVAADERTYLLRGPVYPYRTSKAALNAVIKILSVELEPRGVTAVTVNPGWVRTDMGGADATLVPAESITPLRQLFASITRADSGKFLDYDGSVLPW